MDLTSRLAAIGSVAPRELVDAEAVAAAADEETSAGQHTLVGARADLVARQARAERDLADARADVVSAERRLDDARRNAVQQLRNAHQNLLVAYGRLGDARLADASAATTLSAQRVRLDVGELSPIAWTEAELERARSAASLRAGVHAAWLQRLRYEQALAGG